MLLTEEQLGKLSESEDPNVQALLAHLNIIETSFLEKEEEENDEKIEELLEKINTLEVEVQQEQGDREYYEDKAFQLQIKLDRTENTVYELHDKLESFNLLDSTTLPYTSMYEVLSKKLQKYSPQQIENLLTENFK